MRIKPVEIGPRMDDMTLLILIVISKKNIVRRIPSTFIPITPQNDRRMIYITFHHFLYQPCTSFRIITPMPSGKLININQSERIAHIEKMFIGRIMGTYSIHIHFLDKQSVLQAHCSTRCPPTIY